METNEGGRWERSFTDLLFDCHVSGVAALDVRNIVFSPTFRALCEADACGVYGKCWMCPPDAGEARALIDRVRQYKKALLFQTVTELADPFDVDGMARARREMTAICRALRRALPAELLPHSLILSVGGCGVCERCARLDNAPCRHPEEAMLSLECCCIDVYQTLRSTSLQYKNGEQTVTYFGMLLWNE